MHAWCFKSILFSGPVMSYFLAFVASIDLSQTECLCVGSAAVAQPPINLTAISAAANAALGTSLSPPFDYSSGDFEVLLSAFLFEDVGVTAYNGAVPYLLGSPSLLSAAVSIGLVEGYHSGAVRYPLLVLRVAPRIVSQSHAHCVFSSWTVCKHVHPLFNGQIPRSSCRSVWHCMAW